MPQSTLLRTAQAAAGSANLSDRSELLEKVGRTDLLIDETIP